MNLVCTMRGHAAAPQTVENDGHCFGRCLRCGLDILLRSGRWAEAPRGFRIVWRRAHRPLIASPEPQLSAGPIAERRQWTDRRKADKPLPHFLNGQDRRAGGDRRQAFGRRKLPLR